MAGPRSRELLQRLTNASLATEDFPFMASRRIEIAGVDCVAIRVSFHRRSGLGAALRRRAIRRGFMRALLEAGREMRVGRWAAAR